MAHISERLPASFSNQVVEMLFGLFSIHSLAAANLYDLPAVAEGTWHGACLACAEMARRGLIASDNLEKSVEWISRALSFDIRKGAHSIGSSVRDAAAYALWSLARTNDFSILKQHAVYLALRLATAALYDREIHIRRAASAAFQEHVGRNNSFPHGIDVLGKIDFFAVSIRRNAFHIAAPQVAQHAEYRDFLVDHILNTILRHWDPDMRELGSQSLRLLCQIDPIKLVPRASSQAMHLLDSIDVADLHGSLLALSEICLACRDCCDHALDVYVKRNFDAVNKIPLDIITGPRNAIITAAACRLISVGVTLGDVQSGMVSSPSWKKIVEYGLKHRVASVQEAAASALGSVSKLVDSSASIQRLIHELGSGSYVEQQSLGILLASIDYSVHSNGLSEGLHFILNFVRPSPLPKLVEARRNFFLAIPKMLLTLKNSLSLRISVETFNSIYGSLVGGLNDYSTDARGDVGSWVRIACIRSLADVTTLIFENSSSISNLRAYFPPSLFQNAVSLILKQAVERLDNVRQVAGECLLKIVNLPSLELSGAESWLLPGLPFLRDLFLGNQGLEQWSDKDWLFPKAVQLLDIPEYRESLLSGIVYSLSGKSESIQRPLSASLTSFLRSLPITDKSANIDLGSFILNLFSRLQACPTSNTVVVPVLHTFNILFESDILNALADDARSCESLHKLLSFAGSNIASLKSIPRIQESMKIVINLMILKSFFELCIVKLPVFLGHRFPNVRRNTAEFLYLKIQILDFEQETEEGEFLLLETEWSSENEEVWKLAAERIPKLLEA